MITPAIFEQTMKQHAGNMDTCLDEIDIQNKALDEVVAVLKQFGYDAGADIFANHIVYGRRTNYADDGK